MKKYAIGIDLGTTNCVLAWADLENEQPHVELLRIDQRHAPADRVAAKSRKLSVSADRTGAAIGALVTDGDDATAPVIGRLA